MKKVLCAVLTVVLVFTVVYFAVPELRVRIFVECYDNSIEHGYKTQSGLPGGMNYEASNIWSSDEHDMLELVLFKYGDTSYGCYYSPDDVPLPFQNMNVELMHDGHYYWKWDEESGDTNHGKTSKIKDKWYYFEATY